MPDDSNPLDEFDRDRSNATIFGRARWRVLSPCRVERADGLIKEWTEVLSGRPEPPTH